MLEREQHAAPDLMRIFKRLQARRVLRPGVVAEIAVGRAGGDDQPVVGDLVAAVEHHRAPRGFHAPCFAVDHGDVVLAREDVADRRGDGRRREARGRDLVEQRLEKMMVGPVQHRHAQRRARERARGEQAAEAAADNDDVRRHPSIRREASSFYPT